MRRVSVITVCLNPGDSLARTLVSVRGQRYPAVEHIVVDGGSTDGTLETLARHRPEILVSEPDDGIYAAMDKGAHLARGDILYFLNAGDEFYDSNVIGDVAAFFERTGCDAAFGNLLPVLPPVGPSGDHPAFHAGHVMDFSYFNNRRRFYDECIHHQATFYSNRIFERCGFLCDAGEASGEYHLNVSAFVKYGFSLKYMSRTVARFSLGGVSTMNFNAEWQRFRAARDVLRRRYFPAGARVKVSGANEYLEGIPALKNWIRIFVRGTGHYSRLSEWRIRNQRFLRVLGKK